MGETLIQLFPTGKLSKLRAWVRPEFPDHLQGRNTTGTLAIAVRLSQDPIFIANKPARHDSWDRFIHARPPQADFSKNDRWCIAPANHQWPLTYKPRLPGEDLYAQGVTQDEEIMQSASTKAAKRDAGESVRTYAFLFMGVAIVLLVIMMGLILAKQQGWIGGGDSKSADVITPAAQQVQEIAPGHCVAYVPAIQDFTKVTCPEAAP